MNIIRMTDKDRGPAQLGNMPDTKREFGIMGLGRIGANLSLQAMEKAIRIVGYDIKGVSDELTRAGMVAVDNPAGFARNLSPPRVIFVYVPAGPVVDRLIEDVLPSLDEDDILIDAGNSCWGDSIRRHQRLAEKAIHFIDLGTSGGVEGTRHGACFMAGGERGPIERVEPLLIELAVPGGYVHAGPPGAGHFTKLVHNGIEFGMLQAIAEGIDLLEHYHDSLDIAEVPRCWRAMARLYAPGL
jgi:6-phosphogluconate dehydrogenase